jgi:hypothetical protein
MVESEINAIEELSWKVTFHQFKYMCVTVNFVKCLR